MVIDTIWFHMPLFAANEGRAALSPAHRLRRWCDRGDGALACSVAGAAVRPWTEVFAVLRSSWCSRGGLRQRTWQRRSSAFSGRGDRLCVHQRRAAGGRFLVRRADLARWQMSKVKITVGGPMEEDASRRFVDAWRRAERGESVHERHLAFESWDALARVMTGKRMELLHYVRRHKVGSVRALAKALRRDYSNVQADVQALAAAGLLDTADGSVQADYDVIETRIAI